MKSKLVLFALAAVVAVCVVIAYRSYQERRIVAISVARAQSLVRSDTWLGYHEASALLEVRAARIDPLEAGSLRALAMAMLVADYRDRDAVTSVRAALVEPGRAARVPAHAQLATAALAIGEGRFGTALEYSTRGGEGGLPAVLAARVALLAGNVALASESVDRALASDPELPAALALRGDLARRAGRSDDARQAYAAAIASSTRALSAGLAGSTTRPGASAPHARATFGLAKLALSRQADFEEARAALSRLLDDRAGTPQVERARAALYLAALQARQGDRAGAASTIDKAGLDGELRGWVEKASGQLEVERGPYRVPDGTPPVLVSASDDDPYVPPPAAPPPEPARSKQVLHGFKVHPLAKPAKAIKPVKSAKRAVKTPPRKPARRATGR